MRKLGKKYVEASNKVEKNKAYGVEEAVKLVKETSITKFDSSVEVAMNLNIDTKKSDQQLRGSIVLPNGTGKSKKILVLAIFHWKLLLVVNSFLEKSTIYGINLAVQHWRMNDHTCHQPTLSSQQEKIIRFLCQQLMYFP